MEKDAVSDGTMRCPVPDPEGKGRPCQKRIPVGWRAEEGHGGGHSWQSDASAAAMRTGHFDARALLAGERFTVHQPEDCPGAPDCVSATLGHSPVRWAQGMYQAEG
jgi:hypothetical protein